MKSAATFTWQELLDISQGEMASHYRNFENARLETDTRTLEEGVFFVPLKGQNFDGSQFVEKAYEKGAQGAFVSKSHLNANPDLKRFPNLIGVEDPNRVYMLLAQFHRRRMPAKIVAITGSSGKTTTKEMLFAMLCHKFQVQRSEKNFNNEIGVPMTLLLLEPETQVMILEMGMRGLGQIEELSLTAEPDIGLITNIGPAHIGILGSMEAINEAKCELMRGMNPESAVCVVNGDIPLLLDRSGRCWQGRIEPFSLHEVENIHKLEDGGLSFDYEGVTFTLSLSGSHNVMNALSCIKVAESLGLSLASLSDTLADFEAGGERWQQFELEGGRNFIVINDAYNSNPASLKAALGSFIELKAPEQKKVAVLGCMKELGEHSERYHREIGEWINTHRPMDGLVVIGEEARPIADEVMPETVPTFYVDSNDEAASVILDHWPENVILFLKASRASHFEAIPEIIQRKVQNALSS